MARYEHVRKYVVKSADKKVAFLVPPTGRQYWSKFLSQGLAKSIFNKSLKKGDQVMFKRVTTAYSTSYKPVLLVK